MYAIKIKALDKRRYMRDSYYMYRVLTDFLMKFNINISQRGQVGAAEEALQVEGIVQIFLSCNNLIDIQQQNMTKHLMEENKLLFHL